MVIRTFCVHGHFYQPPREDPLTGIIPYETGASPFRNWNEKIHAECYRPNAELRNFEKISFNVGATLFSWMEAHDPATVHRIVEQDKINVRRYGVGNAMAQAYNHTILPLASTQDKITQVAWGIADFEHRFGRKPQGMWLPETAVDMETLDILARQGIEFTILAPWQADSEEINPAEPYRVELPGGRQIAVFFYQRELSAQVSFDSSSTVNADSFALNILLPYFSRARTGPGQPQMLLVASDGELYGHHKYLRDRFLARLVDGASGLAGLQPIYPALWLKSYPPRQSVRIQDDTSWSCHHGVERWKGDCLCTTGNGTWKEQLRLAMDRLGNELDGLYVEVVAPFVADPWALRDQYIQVHLGQTTITGLLAEQTQKTLTSEQVRRIHLMLEAQREKQRMFTSCGWFFDDFDRIEPKNNIAYAAQAVRLARLATATDLEQASSKDLHLVKSARSGLTADKVFSRHLRRAEGIDSVQVGYPGD